MITVILPVKNVESIIRDCLSSVSWADEVILADGASSDQTLKIASEFGNVRVIQHPSADIRIVVAEVEPLARNPWILWLCADEVLTPELAEEVRGRCATAPPEVAGFLLPSQTMLFGVDWGRGATQPRLWRKGRAKFALKWMHEMPAIEGETPTLRSFYWHINNPNTRTLIPKLVRYGYVDARNATDEECARVNWSFPYQLARFIYFAFRNYWPNRRLGFPAVANAFCSAFGHLLSHLLLAEELRIRRGQTKRDTHGWG